MVRAAGGSSNPNTAIQPNPALLGQAVSFYAVTRLCANADASFSTNDSCVAPAMTYQSTVCRVSSGSYITWVRITPIMLWHHSVMSMLDAARLVVSQQSCHDMLALDRLQHTPTSASRKLTPPPRHDG